MKSPMDFHIAANAGSGSSGWLVEAGRLIRIATSMVLLAGWFAVVGTLAAVEAIRAALTHRS